MTTAELSAARNLGSPHARALEARRTIGWLTLQFAPSAAAGLIALSHLGKFGVALIVFACMLAATQVIDRVGGLPMHLMPASRVIVGFVAPLLGAGAAWLIALAAGDPFPIAESQPVVVGAWLVLALGAWLRSTLNERMVVRVALIAPRDFAADFAEELNASGVTGYEVVGWIDAGGPADYRRLRWLGSLEDVRETVIFERIDLLVCAPADGAVARVEDVCGFAAEQCLDLPVRLMAANQLYEELFGHVPVGTIDAAWYRYIMHPRFRAAAPSSKRIFDLVVATTIAALFAPVMLVAAIAIKLGDRGPVFYRQRRYGEYGEEFEILKLRTMRVDAERDGPQWSGAGDERVTPIGSLLRRTHLDEVPQLWNVLRGEMTMVGPRPERPEIVAELERKFPHYTRRHLVKPGIAGWAALRCGYAGSDLGTAWKLCHDLFYIKRRTVVADALILAETAVEVFRDAHRGLRAPDERFLIGDEARG